jgi:protein-disulfide isomerase
MGDRTDRLATAATIVIAACAVAVTARTYLPLGNHAVTISTKPVGVPNWTKYLADGHVRGPDSARVTILEFGDYECPFCAAAAPRIARFMAAHPGQVRLVYRQWPLAMHRLAYPAARAAECAGQQGAFWAMHDLLIQKQDSLGLIPFAELALRAQIPDLREFGRCNARGEPVPSIEHSIADARALGGTGTPTLVVNGQRLPRGLDSSYLELAFKRSQVH